MARIYVSADTWAAFSLLVAFALSAPVLGINKSVLAQNIADGGSATDVNLVALQLDSGEDIQLDGSIDEAVWRQAIPITDFTQQEPVEGGTPSEPTEIRVVFDAEALYIGAILYDDPDGIIALQKRRDGYLSTDDRFMWILDTFHDGRTGYFFEVNAAGMMGDALLTQTASSGNSSSRSRT